MVGRSKTVGGRWIVNQRSKYGEAWPMQMSCRLLRYSSEFGSCPNFVVCGSERAWPLEHDNYTTWAGACSVVRVRCCLQWRLAGTKRKEEGKRNASHTSLKSRDDHLAGWVVWIWYVYNICVVSVYLKGFVYVNACLYWCVNINMIVNLCALQWYVNIRNVVCAFIYGSETLWSGGWACWFSVQIQTVKTWRKRRQKSYHRDSWCVNINMIVYLCALQWYVNIRNVVCAFIYGSETLWSGGWACWFSVWIQTVKTWRKRRQKSYHRDNCRTAVRACSKGAQFALLFFLFGSMQRDGKHHMGISWNGGTAKSNIIRL